MSKLIMGGLALFVQQLKHEKKQTNRSQNKMILGKSSNISPFQKSNKYYLNKWKTHFFFLYNSLSIDSQIQQN